MTTETQMPAHSEGYGTEEPQASPQQRDEPLLFCIPQHLPEEGFMNRGMDMSVGSATGERA